MAVWEVSRSSLLERFIGVLFKDTRDALLEGVSSTEEQRSALLLTSANM